LAVVIHMLSLPKEAWILILAIPGTIAFVLLLVWAGMKMLSKKLAPLADAFGTDIRISFLLGPHIRVYSDGAETSVCIRSGSKNSPPYLILKRMRPIGFKLHLSKENVATRGLEKLGLLRDIKVGDPVFDDNYLIRSNEAVKAQNYLLYPNHREAIEFFFQEGFRSVLFDKESLTVSKPYYKKHDLDPERVRTFLEAMSRLTSQS
jgi:hypothetical protein